MPGTGSALPGGARRAAAGAVTSPPAAPTPQHDSAWGHNSPASLAGRGFGQHSDTPSSEQLGWENPQCVKTPRLHPATSPGVLPQGWSCGGHPGMLLGWHLLTSVWHLGPPPRSFQEPLPPHSQVSGPAVGVSRDIPLPGWRTRPRCGASPTELCQCRSHWDSGVGGTAGLTPLRTQESGSGKQMSNPDKSPAPLNIAGTAQGRGVSAPACSRS